MLFIALSVLGVLLAIMLPSRIDTLYRMALLTAISIAIGTFCSIMGRSSDLIPKGIGLPTEFWLDVASYASLLLVWLAKLAYYRLVLEAGARQKESSLVQFLY